MEVPYTVVATAINNDTNFFSSNIVIVYNNIAIKTNSDMDMIKSTFKLHKLSLNDLTNILYIYISVTNEKSWKVEKALEYIKIENDNKNCAKLKERCKILEKENEILKKSNEQIMETCNNLCKIINNQWTNEENDIIKHILDENDIM